MEVTSAFVESKLKRMGFVSKILALSALVFCVLFAVAGFIKIIDGVYVITSVDPHMQVGWLQAFFLVNRFVCAASLSFVCFVIFRMFADVGKAVSPFCKKQARRLLLAAITMIVFTIAITVVYNETAIAIIVTPSLAGIANMGYVNQWTIPVSYIVSTAFLFILYALFKYGILLQEVSDDTV